MEVEEFLRDEKYLKCKLKVWQDEIKMNFHDQSVPFGKYGNAAAVLKMDFVYRKTHNWYLQVNLSRCKGGGVSNVSF